MKRQGQVSSNNLIANSMFVLYIFIIAGLLAVAIFSISTLVPKEALQNNVSNNTPIVRQFDQTTVNNVNNLNGSTTELPAGRSNPFSE